MLCSVCSLQVSVFYSVTVALQSLSLCFVQTGKDNNMPTCAFNLVYQVRSHHRSINFTFCWFFQVRTRPLSLSCWVLYCLRKKMGRNGICFSMVLFLLCFTSGIGHTVRLVQGQKTWCVAKPSTDEATLLGNLNYACSQVDCGVLQRGKPCFNPDNLISHASVAMNLYYQSRGRNAWNCNFKNSAIVVLTDPSYGGCVFA